MRQLTRGFSLIEILVGILIVSIVIIAAFQSLSSVGIAKVKLVEQTEIEKQAYFSSERFFELIKKGGTLDYEEYWNRYSYNTGILNGHFSSDSGFGNFGRNGTVGTTGYASRPYNCISNGGLMGTGGCLRDKNLAFNNTSPNLDLLGVPQRYTQYERQFIDRNSDNDSDNGDEDGDGNIVGDDDDLFLGIGPNAFSGAIDENRVQELYLISNDGRERTYFRWNVTDESSSSFAPLSATCTGLNTASPTGEACQGTIEILKLRGEDHGFNHNPLVNDADGSQGDGIIDTWYIDTDFASGNSGIVAGSNPNSYWQSIFPSSVNIRDFEIYVYPNKDIELGWRETNLSKLISPYIRIKYIIEPSLQVRARIRGETPSVGIATTISLSNLDIK